MTKQILVDENHNGNEIQDVVIKSADGVDEIKRAYALVFAGIGI